MRVRHRHRWRRILGWGMVVVLASLTGGLWFAYIYATDSETLAGVIREAAPRFLPGARVDVLSVKPKLLKGEVHLNQVSVMQPLDGSPFQVIRIPWLSVRQDPKRLLEGRLERVDPLGQQRPPAEPARMGRSRQGRNPIEPFWAEPTRHDFDLPPSLIVKLRPGRVRDVPALDRTPLMPRGGVPSRTRSS